MPSRCQIRRTCTGIGVVNSCCARRSGTEWALVIGCQLARWAYQDSWN